ncbi:MAG: peptide chain release factor-like protein [Syntrophotaleaceae bacterium]
MFQQKDLEIGFFRSSGPGGQKKNKTETAVRIRHLPTGITVTATESRSRKMNLERALGRLRARLKALHKKPVLRISTRPSQASREQRLAAKHRRADVKRGRRGDILDE